MCRLVPSSGGGGGGDGKREEQGDGEEGGDEEKKRVDTEKLKEQAMKEQSDCYTWGEGFWGECGLTEEAIECGMVTQPRPVRSLVERDYNIVYVSCGENHTLAVTSEGHVYSWGHSGNGRLGIGDSSHICDHFPSPVLVDRLKHVSITKCTAGFSNSLFLR